MKCKLFYNLILFCQPGKRQWGRWVLSSGTQLENLQLFRAVALTCKQSTAPTVAKAKQKQRQLSKRCCNILNTIAVVVPVVVVVVLTGAPGRKSQKTSSSSTAHSRCQKFIVQLVCCRALRTVPSYLSRVLTVQLLYFTSHSKIFLKKFA